jgi:hypothetical protein
MLLFFRALVLPILTFSVVFLFLLPSLAIFFFPFDVAVMVLCCFCFFVPVLLSFWKKKKQVFPSYVRAKALSVALFVTRSLAGAISMSFESLLKALTPTGVWLGFAAISVMAFAFVAHFLPETKGLSLEKVRTMGEACVGGSGDQIEYEWGGPSSYFISFA